MAEQHHHQLQPYHESPVYYETEAELWKKFFNFDDDDDAQIASVGTQIAQDKDQFKANGQLDTEIYDEIQAKRVRYDNQFPNDKELTVAFQSPQLNTVVGRPGVEHLVGQFSVGQSYVGQFPAVEQPVVECHGSFPLPPNDEIPGVECHGSFPFPPNDEITGVESHGGLPLPPNDEIPMPAKRVAKRKRATKKNNNVPAKAISSPSLRSVMTYPYSMPSNYAQSIANALVMPASMSAQEQSRRRAAIVTILTPTNPSNDPSIRQPPAAIEIPPLQPADQVSSFTPVIGMPEGPEKETAKAANNVLANERRDRGKTRNNFAATRTRRHKERAIAYRAEKIAWLEARMNFWWAVSVALGAGIGEWQAVDEDVREYMIADRRFGPTDWRNDDPDADLAQQDGQEMN